MKRTETASRSGLETPDFRPVLRFAVFADAHFAKSSAESVTPAFLQALETFYALSAGCAAHNTLDALVFPGDYLHVGDRESYEYLVEVLKANVKAETGILACLGNHEFYHAAGGNDIVDTEEAAADMKKYLGADLDTHTKINGFHFILNSLRCNPKDGTYWSDTANLDWLAREMKAAAQADPKKPIFAFSHVGFDHTIAKSIGNQWFFNFGFGAVYGIYRDYPQIINFSGHDHHPLNFENSIHQRDFTTVSAGHLVPGYIGGAVNSREYCNTATAQCLLVEADAHNTVRIRRYDVLNDRFMPDWVIPDPADKSGFRYTDARAERYRDTRFAAGARITVSQATEAGAEITFPAIESNPNILYYRVCVFDGDQVISKELVPSLIWLPEVPKEFKKTVGSLAPHHEYTVRVAAVDSYYHESDSLTAVIAAR